jgi:hypothetical protein
MQFGITTPCFVGKYTAFFACLQVLSRKNPKNDARAWIYGYFEQHLQNF